MQYNAIQRSLMQYNHTKKFNIIQCYSQQFEIMPAWNDMPQALLEKNSFPLLRIIVCATFCCFNSSLNCVCYI